MTFTLQILFLFIPIKEKNHFANVWVLYLHIVKEVKKKRNTHKTKQNRNTMDSWIYFGLRGIWQISEHKQMIEEDDSANCE